MKNINNKRYFINQTFKHVFECVLTMDQYGGNCPTHLSLITAIFFVITEGH